MTDLKNLRELASKASFTKIELQSLSKHWLCYATEPDISSGEFVAEFVYKEAAEYFAAANPVTVTALIDRIEKLESQLKEANELIEFYGAGGNFNSDVWQHENLGFFTGKRARAYLKKWGEK